MTEKAGAPAWMTKSRVAPHSTSVACPECGSTVGSVIDSRPVEGRIKRRRICDNLHRFTTYEDVEINGGSKTISLRHIPIMVARLERILASLRALDPRVDREGN